MIIRHHAEAYKAALVALEMMTRAARLQARTLAHIAAGYDLEATADGRRLRRLQDETHARLAGLTDHLDQLHAAAGEYAEACGVEGGAQAFSGGGSKTDPEDP